jgi:hypothetical protein
MDRFISTALELPEAAARGEFSRADLIFYGVSHRGNSFRAKVFLDEPGEDPDTSPEREEGLTGTFTIFGHGGCVGFDESHCDPADEPDDPFDTRPPHPLEPQTKFVEVTEALQAIRGERVVVTVIPVRPAERGPELSDELTLSGVRLLTYAD